jgi:tetratricopeptide (TPR) repeat protein
MVIRIPELPDEISLCQKLRLALVKEDSTEYNMLANELILQGDPAGGAVENTLNRYGYMFIRSQGGLDEALELFMLNVKLFPDSYRVWDSLGEGTMIAGNNDLAISYYEKSLALNPSNENARRIVKILKEKI